MSGTSATGSTRVAAVVGSPVRHSKSPAIHNAAFAALGIDANYVAIELGQGCGQQALDLFRNDNMLGLNVTMPLKAEISHLVDELTPNAVALESCNTVINSDGRLIGDSTDGRGFVAAFLESFPGGFDGASVVVLGAGGAARSIINALDVTKVQDIAVVNRTPKKAQLAALLAGKAFVADFDCLADADIVVNTTSVGMAGSATGSPVPDGLIGQNHKVVDIIYNPAVTPLLAQAKAVGAQTMGGLPMLIHQAALSFEAWTGLDAPLDAMRAGATA